MSDIKRVSEAFLAGHERKLSEDSLAILRCPYLSPRRNVWRLYFEPVAVTGTSLADLRECLPKLLRRVNTGNREKHGVGLLGALGFYGDFEQYPETEDDARVLAVAIIFYISNYAPANARDAVIKPHVCNLLNAWLKPVQPWDDLPTVRDLCFHMFGDLWCSMELPDGDLREASIDELVERARPPFHNGFTVESATSLLLPDNLGTGA
jgi:hypothetical protein